jgi:hypothetical protein
MRTIIEIGTSTWADVKHFATVNNITLSRAVEKLLRNALQKSGYTVKNKVDLNE